MYSLWQPSSGYKSREERKCRDKNGTNEKTSVEEKKPLPKKKKVLYSIIGSIIVILIGFIVWAQSYQSPQAVEKRFYEAVANEDAKVLQKLLVHEDGSSIKKRGSKGISKADKRRRRACDRGCGIH